MAIWMQPALRKPEKENRAPILPEPHIGVVTQEARSSANMIQDINWKKKRHRFRAKWSFKHGDVYVVCLGNSNPD